MDHSELDAALFFGPVPGAYAIYRAFANAVLSAYPESRVKVQKTQITFYNPRVYACASLLRARRKVELPKPWLTITLGLPYRLESPRRNRNGDPASFRFRLATDTLAFG